MSHGDWLMLELNMTQVTGHEHWPPLSQQEQGGVVVITDMLLSVVTVITNLVTISAIREQDTMTMVHILLANLTISNLISSVLVNIANSENH